MPQHFFKEPAAVLDYVINWDAWLAENDYITVSSWTVPTGMTKTSATFTQRNATVWLSGGLAGHRYEVVNRVTTLLGRTDERTIFIRVVNC